MSTSELAVSNIRPQAGLGRGGAEPKAIEVTFEDQSRINRFGQLNNRSEELSAELKKIKVKLLLLSRWHNLKISQEDVDNLEDAASAVELLMDDGDCLYVSHSLTAITHYSHVMCRYCLLFIIDSICNIFYQLFRFDSIGCDTEISSSKARRRNPWSSLRRRRSKLGSDSTCLMENERILIAR